MRGAYSAPKIWASYMLCEAHIEPPKYAPPIMHSIPTPPRAENLFKNDKNLKIRNPSTCPYLIQHNNGENFKI